MTVRGSFAGSRFALALALVAALWASTATGGDRRDIVFDCAPSLPDFRHREGCRSGSDRPFVTPAR